MIEINFGLDWIARIDVFAVLWWGVLVWIGAQWGGIGNTHIQGEGDDRKGIMPPGFYVMMWKKSIGLSWGSEEKVDDAVDVIDECERLVTEIKASSKERITILPKQALPEKLQVGDKTIDEYVEYDHNKVHPSFRRRTLKEADEYLKNELGYPQKNRS